MYYINSKLKLKPSVFALHMVPALVVLVTMLGLTLLAWRNANEALTNERDVVSRTTANEATRRINEHFTSYDIVLTAGAGLFTSANGVTRSEWTDFVKGFDLKSKYPGIKGVGFAKYVPSNEYKEFTRSVRSEGFTNFNIYPAGVRQDYAVNLYYEPFSKNGLGFDFMSNNERKAAMTKAKDSAKPALTNKLDFIKDKTDPGESGFIMFYPVYKNSTRQVPEPSKRDVEGFIFAPITAKVFFDQFFGQPENKDYSVKIYDPAVSKENLVYQSPNATQHTEKPFYTYTSKVQAYDHSWQVVFNFYPGIVSTTTRDRPMNTLVAGLILSPMLAIFVFTLLAARAKALSIEQKEEVNNAKDELLSLASHQLRTPATSVKQYIGMLKEGFAGSLTPQQMQLVNRAYDSNERQLHIINELLYVAKIDAKGIVLTPTKIDLKKLIRTQAEDLGATAKKTGQRIRVYLPNKKVTIQADEHCIGMAVENLISNALKYSHDGSLVTIKLIEHKESVDIIIKDRGIGISQDEISMLFQRFSRIPNKFSQQISGSGIGLYLSQQLINLHAGTIEVDSVKDKGTTFTIKLPKIFVH